MAIRVGLAGLCRSLLVVFRPGAYLCLSVQPSLVSGSSGMSIGESFISLPKSGLLGFRNGTINFLFTGFFNSSFFRVTGGNRWDGVGEWVWPASLQELFITGRQMEPTATFLGRFGNVASGRNCRTVVRDFFAGRAHSFLNLIALLENDWNTVLPEWMKQSDGG